MDLLLLLPFLIPAAGSLFVRTLGQSATEKTVSKISLLSASLHGITTATLFSALVFGSRLSARIPIFAWGDDIFRISLNLDYAGILLLVLISFFFGIVVRFSRTYLHREKRIAHYFSVLQVFASGMSLVALADNLETFFIGWEMVGIASFLLIAFYRDRANPIRQAVKVFSIYRLCDVGLLISVLIEHNLGSDFKFSTLRTLIDSQQNFVVTGSHVIALLLILASVGKSAQFPFTFWLPRAMEGPTPSSAIFYGALSVHAGVFLLFRTSVIWSQIPALPWIVGAIGIVTAVLATGIARVQSTIKGQIAYASATQVGLMFVELALGWDYLALFHMTANALFRCYQLLVSPSAAAYLLELQAKGKFSTVSGFSSESWLPDRLRKSLFVFSIREGFLEELVSAIFFRPLILCGGWTRKPLFLWFSSLGLLGTLCWTMLFRVSPPFPWLISLIGLGISLRAFSAPVPNLTMSVLMASGSNFLLALAAVDHLSFQGLHELMPFLIGVLLLTLAFIPATRIATADRRETAIFFIILGLIGFPITPVFFGEDLVMDFVFHKDSFALAAFVMGFIINGIALITVYANCVMPNKEMSHEGILERIR